MSRRYGRDESVKAWTYAFVVGRPSFSGPACSLASHRTPAYAVGKELLLVSAYSFNVQRSWK